MIKKITFGTRGSPLAIIQTNRVIAQIQVADNKLVAIDTGETHVSGISNTKYASELTPSYSSSTTSLKKTPVVFTGSPVAALNKPKLFVRFSKPSVNICLA